MGWNWQLCFHKCIIHNIQTQKIWYYFDPCLRVPFDRWEHSRGRHGCQTIDLNDTRGLWHLELTVFLPKMHYKQYHQSSGQRVAYHFWPNKWPSVPMVLYIVRYLCNFIYFISHSISISSKSGFWAAATPIMLLKMHYEQYPNSENVVLFLYISPSNRHR